MRRVLPLEIVHVDDSINVSRGGRPIPASNVQALAEDIKANGQMEAVGVVSLDGALWLDEETRIGFAADGKEFVLIYGFRRFKAHEVAGLTEVFVDDLGELSRPFAELANVAENCARENPNEYDLAVACARLVRMHKVDPRTVAQRVNRPVRHVEESVAIITRVRRDLLDHYRVTCTREMRRRMIALAAFEGTERERHEQQAAWWKQDQKAQTEQVNKDPIGRNKSGKRGAGAKPLASRSDYRAGAERLMTGREVFDGRQWRVLDESTRGALRELVQWALNPNAEFPVR